MLKRNWKIFFIMLSQIGDFLALLCAGMVVLALRGNPMIGTAMSIEQLQVGFGIFACVYIVLASMMGLYRGSFHLSLRLQIMLIAKIFITSLLIFLAIVSLVNRIYIGRTALVGFVFSAVLFLLLERILLRSFNLLCQKYGYGVHNSLVVGFEHDAVKIFRRFTIFPELGYKVKGFVVRQNSELATSSALQPQYTMQELDGIIELKGIDRIFIPSTEIIVDGYTSLKAISKRHNVKLKVLSPHAEELLKIARIYDIAGITLVSPRRSHVNLLKQFFKRGFDIVCGSFIILFLSPLFLLTVVAIYIESKGPIFFFANTCRTSGK